jgi:hypothetical protein
MDAHEELEEHRQDTGTSVHKAPPQDPATGEAWLAAHHEHGHPANEQSKLDSSMDS